MIDFNDLLANPAKYIQACETKNSSLKAADIEQIATLGKEKRVLEKEIMELRAESNVLNEQIKQKQGKPSPEQIEKGKNLKVKVKELEVKLGEIEPAFQTLITKVPNPPSEDTPIGKDENENVVLRKWGEPKRFDFPAKEHWQLGQELDVIDIERATKVSGTRFAYLKGGLVRLQFALINMVLDSLADPYFIEEIIVEKKLNLKTTSFTPVIPPVIIKPDPFARMARLEPKEERYYIPSDDSYLVGSAEHTLGAMYMDETLDEKELPVRLVGYSTSFRREAGSYGKDTKGILRLHQFDKVEMEVFSTPETSWAEQELLIGIQEKIMQMLGISYQIIICCTGDQGDPDARHLDLESWLPGQDQYRETHSADLMTDYQARRLNTKVKRSDGSKELLHTNDATAVAIGRTLIAIMENYQRADGSIEVPEVLRKYAGIEEIKKN